ERLDRVPNGHVEENPIVVIRPKVRRVPLIALEPPDESGTAVGERIDLVEKRHKVAHLDTIERGEHSSDVHLSQSETMRSHWSSRSFRRSFKYRPFDNRQMRSRRQADADKRFALY